MSDERTSGKVIDLMAALKASLRKPLTERDWQEDFGYENGDYDNFCVGCDHEFRGHKRRVICKLCSTSTGGQRDGG